MQIIGGGGGGGHGHPRAPYSYGPDQTTHPTKLIIGVAPITQLRTGVMGGHLML